VKADIMRIGATDAQGFNGAIAVGDVGDSIFAASFCNEGKSLATLLEEEGAVDEDIAVAIILDLNHILSPLHETGVALRGIRPERIYQDEATGKSHVDAVACIICDEGLVAPGSFKLAEELGYLAPERYGGEEPYGSIYGDMFSLGSVLYRLMVGAPVHLESEPEAYVKALRTKRPRSLREVLGNRCTRAVSDTIKRCLVPKPNRRFESIELFSQGLRKRRKPSPSGIFKAPGEKVRLEEFAGLDLGSHYSRVCVLNEDSSPRFSFESDGRRLIPSAVHLPALGLPIVGERALKETRNDPQGLRRGFMGELGDTEGGEPSVLLASVLVSHLLDKVRAGSDSRPRELAFAVPTAFTERERGLLWTAGELAGIRVLGTIPSPTAAALSYGMSRDSKPSRALVCDIGAQHASLAVVEIRGGNVQVLATTGTRGLGGESWNRRMRRLVREHCGNERFGRILSDPLDRFLLDEHLEAAKRVLTKRKDARIIVPDPQQSSRFALQRSVFENATKDVLSRLASRIEHVIEKSNVDLRRIDRVIAVGGAAAMPSVVSLIRRMTTRGPDASLDRATASVQGAAYFALNAKYRRGDRFERKHARIARQILVRNLTPVSYGIAVDGDDGLIIRHVLIPEQSLLPTKVTKVFSFTPRQAGQVIRLKLAQRDSWDDRVRPVATCAIHDLPIREGRPVQLALGFSLSEHGQLTVRARDSQTGARCKVELERPFSGSEGKQELKTMLRKLTSL